MSRHLRLIAALGAVFLAGGGLAACGGVPGDAVVSVNGNSITTSAYNHWLSVAAASSAAAVPGQKAAKPVVPDPPDYTACIAHLEATAPKPAKGQSKPTAAQLKSQCAQQYTALKQQVLGFLISSEWVMGEAEEQGVKVSDKEVLKEYNQLKKQQFPKEEAFKKFLANTGQTVSDLLLRVKLNMLAQRIQQRISKDAKKPVTSAQISKYYSEHKSQFGQPERRNLLIVLTKKEPEAKSAKEQIEHGESFAKVAKKMSIDPVSKNNGGQLLDVVKGQEEKALDTAVFAAKVNTLSGPVKTPFGYYVFKVVKVLPASQQTLAQAHESIKQQLTAQQQQQALSKFIKGFQTKWKQRTDCRASYVVPDCKQYKAPKTPSFTPTTPATPQTTVTGTIQTKSAKK